MEMEEQVRIKHKKGIMEDLKIRLVLRDLIVGLKFRIILEIL
jgi:hypothetical protein